MKIRVQRRDIEGEFEVKDVQIDDAKTRSFITIAVLSVSIVFLVGSAIYGLYLGEFGALSGVVMAIEAPVFTILGYYFGKHR